MKQVLAKNNGKIIINTLAAASQLTETRNPVLLVTIAGTAKRDVALLRAANLARLLNTDLYVARVIPSQTLLNPLFPSVNLNQTMATVGQTAAIVRRTWRWCNSKLLKPLPQEHIFVREGTLARVAISVAQQIEASAVVVSGADTASGADIMTIVAEAKVPVLVSRKAQPSESIVAATDLLNESVPVLRRGVQLSTATDNEITFVHNVEPRPQYFVGTVDRGGFVIELPPEPERVKLKEDRLRKIAAELGSDINTVIANKEDTANAILAVARRNQADLVVVGRHHRTWIERVFGENVAAAVVERAERSVLVVPISA